MPKYFRIELDGEQLDAAIGLEPGAIILESRGGTGAYARNSQYSSALETILARSLGPFSNLERVLLASRDAVRSVPDAASRVLAEGPELVALGPAAAASAVRTRMRDFGKPPGNHVGNSTKRLTNSAQRQVTPADIHSAVLALAQGGDAPNFADSRDYDLVTPGGLRFPPKKVFGLALERALGIEAFPAHFSAGWSQPSFQLLQAAGYVIVPKGKPVAGDKAAAPGSPPLPSEDDDRRWVEGHPKRVAHLRRERAPGLARDKKAAVLVARNVGSSLPKDTARRSSMPVLMYTTRSRSLTFPPAPRPRSQTSPCSAPPATASNTVRSRSPSRADHSEDDNWAASCSLGFRRTDWES